MPRGKSGREHISFEAQAPLFEARAGLDDAVERAVADAVLAAAALDADDLVLEIGAGTGEIGRYLAAGAPRYVGIDSSPAMLAEFTPRLPAGADATLIEVDADGDWPLENDSVALIFGSRVFHLLDTEHLLAEALRTGRRRGFALLAGRVLRADDAPKELARRKMRDLLESHGEAPRPTERRRRRLWDRAVELGGVLTAPAAVARWPVTATVRDAVDGWKAKDSLGGVTPPAHVRDAVLAELDRWADALGPAGSITSEETYVLEGVRFAAEGASA